MISVLQNLMIVPMLVSLSAAAELDQASALKFNQAIVRANEQLGKAGFAFGKSVSPLFSGKPVNLKKVAQAYVDVISTLEKVEREMKNINVPRSEKARAFYRSHQKFLRGQRKMVMNNFAEMLSIAVNPKFDLRTRKVKIRSILNLGEKLEKAPLSDLSKAQLEFVNFYDIKLEY